MDIKIDSESLKVKKKYIQDEIERSVDSKISSLVLKILSLCIVLFLNELQGGGGVRVLCHNLDRSESRTTEEENYRV